MSRSRDLTTGDHHVWELTDEPHAPDSITVLPPASYRQAFGDKPIRLGLIEFHILLCLASRPYYAFTRRQIADAVAHDAALVIDESNIDGHIATLRDQLGVLRDFVQTVPYVGYRYKA